MFKLCPPMWELFQRYRALDREARETFRRAAVLLLILAISLRLRGYKKTQQGLQKRVATCVSTEQGKNGDERVRKTRRMVNAAVHYGLLRASCLEESLTLWYLLARQGIPSSLRIGVRKSGEQFEAHAWVECSGVALNEAEQVHQHYAAFQNEFAEPLAEQR